jgi:hypothetical protein
VISLEPAARRGNVTDNLADLVKYHDFTINKEPADLQRRLAELTGTGKLDPRDNDDLQRHLHNVYEELMGGLTSAVIGLGDDGNLEDNYSDGSTVVVKNHDLEPGSRWPHNEFLWGNGPAAEFLPRCESTVNFPPQPLERLR